MSGALSKLALLVDLCKPHNRLIDAAWSDAINFTIPNRLVVSLPVLYRAYAMTFGHTVKCSRALAIATGILAIGLFL